MLPRLFGRGKPDTAPALNGWRSIANEPGKRSKHSGVIWKTGQRSLSERSYPCGEARRSTKYISNSPLPLARTLPRGVKVNASEWELVSGEW